LFLGSVCALLIAGSACRAPKRIVLLDPGRSYHLEFTSAPDDTPIGAELTGDHLQGTTFEVMLHPPIILKADDYGHPIDPISQGLFDWLRARGYVASLGIITSHLAESRESAAQYRELEHDGFELWFHGHTHRLEKTSGEFSNTPLADQERSFAEGLRIGRELLGTDFTTFGAPGNAYDTTTATAVRSHPQIEAWFFGPKYSPVFTFPRIAELEVSPGRVGEPEVMVAALRRASTIDAPALTLQIHPRGWSKDELANAEAILEKWCATTQCRVTTPSLERRWYMERSKIRFKKLDLRSYRVDLSGATTRLRIEASKPMIAR
jgi:hypothetical protein